MQNSKEYIVDMSLDNSFKSLDNKLKDIPIDCTTLVVSGHFLQEMFFQGKMRLWGDTTLWLPFLGKSLKKLPRLKTLDLSKCTEITGFTSSISNLDIECIILPEKVKVLPAFYYCPNLKRIVGKGLIKIRDINYCPNIEDIEFNPLLEEIEIPNTKIRTLNLPNIKHIGWNAFENCKNLTEITLPKTIEYIKPKAFKNCSSLYKISIPNIDIIQNSTFENCTALQELILPKSLVSIEECAFKGCTKLESIKGGINIEKISKDAFNGCTNIKSLPFKKAILKEDIFGQPKQKLFGIILSSRRTNIIWSFSDFQFYHSKLDFDYEQEGEIVSFNQGEFVSFHSNGNSTLIEHNFINIATNISKVDNKKIISIPHHDAIKMYLESPYKHLPKINVLYEKFKKQVDSLNIKDIINSYSTSVNESQNWKIGGDNTYHFKKDTSILYTDPYIETFLPTIHEERFESSYFDYSQIFNHNLKKEQEKEDKSRKSYAKKHYSKKAHIATLIDHYIKSYHDEKMYIEKEIHLEFAKEILEYWLCNKYRQYDNINIYLQSLCKEQKFITTIWDIFPIKTDNQ